jgi:hypothetical protein
MGLFSFVGGLIGAGAQKKASRNAQAAMNDALNKAIGVQQAQNQQTRTDFAPEMGLGNSAIGEYGDLTGANGADKWAASLAALHDDPLYKSLYSNGEEAVLQNASATGGIRGGNTEGALAHFGADTLATTLQQRLAQLMASIGIGTQAKGAITGVGLNTSNNVSGLNTSIGQNNSSNILTRGGITAGMWNSAGSFLDQAVSAAFGAGGLGGGAAGGAGGFNLGAFAGKMF